LPKTRSPFGSDSRIPNLQDTKVRKAMKMDETSVGNLRAQDVQLDEIRKAAQVLQSLIRHSLTPEVEPLQIVEIVQMTQSFVGNVSCIESEVLDLWKTAQGVEVPIGSVGRMKTDTVDVIAKVIPDHCSKRIESGRLSPCTLLPIVGDMTAKPSDSCDRLLLSLRPPHFARKPTKSTAK
jgi:hypothetical protein